MCRKSVPCFLRKLNVTDFQCKHKGEYILNVNIFNSVWECLVLFFSFGMYGVFLCLIECLFVCFYIYFFGLQGGGGGGYKM